MKQTKLDLSIIIPFAGEHPQVLFTIQAINESLKGKLDFEIIAVNNHCPELESQWANLKQKAVNKVTDIRIKEERGSDINIFDIDEIIKLLPPAMNDRAGEAIKAAERGNDWLRYMEFTERLSHWECKRLACKEAKADTFLFIDAHCIPSNGIADMYSTYINGYDNIGSFHMPLTYKILEWHRLVYKMVIENNFYGYSFTSFPAINDTNLDPVEVPCMSTCGMMISKQIYERVGGWPKHFGAYGGGENFMNYALSVTGHLKFIYPGVTLHHHGDRRDYHSQYDTTLWNRLAAHYLFGGKEALYKLHSVSKGKPVVLSKMVMYILSYKAYIAQRELIKKNTVISLDQWQKDWETK